ncbi:MAG TPA: SDR family NAD(P)-dependent oxidoreductase [Polyangiaceae bacterium]|nr:SDR family NAD(P)-dependent oxidoreductase [Polyangiaceae bacterium]
MTPSTAVLIGVTGGLGVALARLLAQQGFRLVLSARRDTEAQTLMGESNGAIYMRADVSERASVERLAAAALEHLGRIDAVVNLAGISPRKRIEEYTVDDVEALLAVNVKGPIFTTQAFVPLLRKQPEGGIIVQVGGAVDGRVALPFQSAYAATRGALANYVQSANRELEGTNVLLSFFGPAPSNTESESAYFDMWRKMGVALVQPERVAREILDTIRERRRLHVMGGWQLRTMSLVNALSPAAADRLALRRFTRIFERHGPTHS